MQSEYKVPDRKITIFSNLWYKSGPVLKNGVLVNYEITWPKKVINNRLILIANLF